MKVEYASSTNSFQKNDSMSSESSSQPIQKKNKKTFSQEFMDVITLKKMFEKIEERPTPPEVYNIRIYLTAIMASAAAIIIGYDGGFIGGTMALPSFLEEFGLDVMTESDRNYVISNIISVFHVGCFFGSLISYPFSYYFGRRMSLIIAAVTITFGSGIMLASTATRNLGPIYAGRVLAGLAVGFSTNLTPVYLSEISPPAIRGRIIAMYEIGWRVGDLIGFWINYGISEHIPHSNKQWIIPFAVQLIPSALFLAGSVFMKESPRWLLSTGKYDRAIDNLKWFRQLEEDHEYLIYEVNQVKESLDKQQREVGLGVWDPAKQVFFRDRKLLFRLGITSGLFVLQNFMGIQSINYYSPIIFKNLGVKGTNATLFSTGMFGVVKFVASFCYIMFVVDTFGRRGAFMVTSSLCSLCFWYIGAYLKLNDPTQPGVSGGPGGTAAIAMMYIWIASFILAWSAGPYVIGSEVFDQNIRSFVQAINAAASWAPIFVMSRWTTNMIAAMHYGIYFFFASVCLLTVPFVFYLVPETKGIALEDMDKLFDRNLPAWRAHEVVLGNARNASERQIHENKGLFKMDTNKSNEIQNIEDIQLLTTDKKDEIVA
ncbi:high-affinity glucose transporter 1 [[Candida] anglica]|uniref:Quinate transporter n=1 Tax=[Candida] anglica TaxID=148631 RepID=A0ABP0EC55_9ASCO